MIFRVDELLNNIENTVTPLDELISVDSFCTLDLSIFNNDLDTIEIINPNSCQQYIDIILEEQNAKVAYGGYLEKRNLYRDKSSFSNQGTSRNIHLGIDFWTSAGTKVVTPLNGRVHSFKNNKMTGDYGPTIILQHQVDGFEFHTLFGHLSLESIKNIQIGQEFKKGAAIGNLGTTNINVNYAPHLHFQIIVDMEGMKGDYPGVCSEDTLAFYKKNCPNPNLLLKL